MGQEPWAPEAEVAALRRALRVVPVPHGARPIPLRPGARPMNARMGRRRFLRGAVTAGLGLGVAGGLAHAAHSGLVVRRHRLAWPVARPVRLVHLTDLHVGLGTPAVRLEEVVRLSHAARPDLVVLTGDYVNHSLRHVARVERLVAALPGPVVATLGNHDHWSGAGGVIDALQRGGARVLQNASLSLDALGLSLVGVDDGRTGHDDAHRALSGVDPASSLVLTHDPRTADRISELGGRLVLSGHTHGGQVRVPGVERLARAAGLDYLGGWYPLPSGGRVYVNAGCGQSRAGWRLGDEARAELSVFELVPLRAG
jgi:predicted MPP superfamily phosphohydrolase